MRKLRWALFALFALFCAWSFPDDSGLTMRARITRMTPVEPSDINWRVGGEGLGLESKRGVLARKLDVGEWSPKISVATFFPSNVGDTLFVTFTCGRPGVRAAKDPGNATGYTEEVSLEFEFYYNGELLKAFHEDGPGGGTVAIRIPVVAIGEGKPGKDFTDNLGGLLSFVQNRESFVEHLPWIKNPVPHKYAVLTDLFGYGVGCGYGIHTTNMDVMKTEARTLGMLGINGFASAPDFLLEKNDSAPSGFFRARYVQIGGFPVAKSKSREAAVPEAGCPYGSHVPEITRQNVLNALNLVLPLPVGEVWGRTVDEIGAVIDLTPEKKEHLSVCPRCTLGFTRYLQAKGFHPADFDAPTWNEIKPLAIWSPSVGNLSSLSKRSTALLAYWTAMFNNDVTSGLFAPLRKAFEDANASKSSTGDAKQPSVYSFALRGCSFIAQGHSLDFFDFYRHADNAFVYEGSNRDPRIWQWDDYLSDVARMITAEQNLRFGVYVKPNRGAPIQRALSALSRGATMIYWYTYGPEWGKGDSFSGDPQSLIDVSKAARLIASSEDTLYGSSWAKPAEIAVLNPRTSEVWLTLSGKSPEWIAAWENAKWIYSALSHAHLEVDPVDEVMIAKGCLSRYRVLYVSGPNVTMEAAQKIAAWVKEGGTLYVSGWGMVADEANSPMDFLLPQMGLSSRSRPELWGGVQLYDSTTLLPFLRMDLPFAGISMTGLSGSFPLTVGREILHPLEESDTLAKFSDGNSAIIGHHSGKGMVYVVGFYPGLEYSSTLRVDHFNMATDLDSVRRSCVLLPVEGFKPVVDTGHSTVEGVLLRNSQTGRLAISLMNWTYREKEVEQKKENDHAGFTVRLERMLRSLFSRLPMESELVSIQDLKITIPEMKEVSAVTSVQLQRELPFSRNGDAITIQLPGLAEADVLLLN